MKRIRERNLNEKKTKKIRNKTKKIKKEKKKGREKEGIMLAIGKDLELYVVHGREMNLRNR